MVTTSTLVQVDYLDRIATITISRPGALNALNRSVLVQLGDALRQIEANSEIDVVIVTGSGEKAFVVGADIAEMVDMTPEEALAFSRLGQEVTLLLSDGPKLSIAAVQGFALGGGCELALACDMVFAGPNAKFGQPEVRLGVIPGFGGTQRLTRLVGIQRANYLITSGAILTADEAFAWGLVTQKCDTNVLEYSLAFARKIVNEMGMLAVAQAKETIRLGTGLPLRQALEIEAQRFAACFATTDQTEGMRAFIEKRPPSFQRS
ncbi:MAG: enoyl-CoA hydratase/isomerase family protein [Myxococcales bacterium]|nr:enoyl-CoA hydratase/isomerase family protein [Myxococcales bacterium]